MSKQQHLVEMIGELGPSPIGVDIETFAISEIDPGLLKSSIDRVTPDYEGYKYILDKNPELFRYLTEEPQPEIALGESIKTRQLDLSKNSRLLATAMTSVALFGGMFGLIRGAQGAAEESVRQSYQELNLPYSFTEEDNKDDIKRAAGVSALISLASIPTTGLVGILFSHRLARRPAKKAVRKAEQASA